MFCVFLYISCYTQIPSLDSEIIRSAAGTVATATLFFPKKHLPVHLKGHFTQITNIFIFIDRYHQRDLRDPALNIVMT